MQKNRQWEWTGGVKIHEIALSYYQNKELVIVALIIFLVVFVGLVIWVNLKPNRTIYKKLERLPLEDEEDKNE